MAGLPIITKTSYTEADLLIIVEEVKKAEPLLAQGLLREDELNKLQSIEKHAYELMVNHDSVQYRKYDRSRREATRWREVSRSGYVDLDDAYVLLELKQQIIELLNLHQIPVQPTEIFLPPNSEHTGRVTVRNILSRASTSIDIKDDYLFGVNKTTKNIDLLLIVGPYLDTSLNITLRLLGSSDSLPSAVLSDVKAFITQYPTVQIKGFSHSTDGDKETHDRFIIIDGSEVYKIGASIKDLGSAQTSIDKVNDPAITAQFIHYFSSWWSRATAYPDL